MSLSNELKRLGKDIVKDAKKLAKPNKKTGRLEKSLDYDIVITNDDSFSVVIEEVYYGEYLNKKTDYMDKAIDKNLNRSIDKIVDTLLDDLLTDSINR